MHKEGEEIHVSEAEASGGSKEGVVRWVLLGGLVLAIALLSVTWLIPALSGDGTDDAARHDRATEMGRPQGDLN
ncbi:hypothetical protein [Qipengyuania sp. RANM35]|uniref:hypothetical protein n=1 Tax=Qipengyuania sp. RANM35 TaxID=3068635 RepID=UPI0034DAE3AA